MLRSLLKANFVVNPKFLLCL